MRYLQIALLVIDRHVIDGHEHNFNDYHFKCLYELKTMSQNVWFRDCCIYNDEFYVDVLRINSYLYDTISV